MSEHYSTAKPTSDPHYNEFSFEIEGSNVTITTVSGVFGKQRLDRGSKVLFTNADLSDAKSALDLGCGTGVVGIAVAKRYPDLKVTFSDVNERAVSIAKQNAKRNGVSGRFVTANGFEGLGSFDAILLNPPQSAGKAICERLIMQSQSHLTKSGKLFLVARHRKGGRALSTYMHTVFPVVETIAKKSGYRVYVGHVHA